MATSSKVKFNLETLKKKALESIDARIASKKEEVNSYEDPAQLAESVKLWRARQEQKLSDLFRQLGEGGIDDYKLSRFQLEPIPEADRYDRNRAVRELRALEATRTQVVAKAGSLVADADGNISLTNTQMSEFFGL